MTGCVVVGGVLKNFMKNSKITVSLNLFCANFKLHSRKGHCTSQFIYLWCQERDLNQGRLAYEGLK